MLNTAEWSRLWIPPEHLPLSTWAEKNLQLSSEYARRRGGLTLYGWQRDIFDSFTDPRVSEIVLMCGTQLVKTLFIQAAVAYVICEAPGPILILQPSEGDAKAFSKERLSPMLRDCPVLQGKISAAKSRDASNTIQEKWFPGGMLAVDGAISPANVARRSIRYFFTDEIDKKGYNPGVEGDVIALGDERVATYESLGKKIRTCSPTVFGRSRIGKAYQATDRRKPWVKCIGCGHYQLLTWSQVCFDPVGYKCEHCGDLWGDIERWESCDKYVDWRNEAPFVGRAGFWISHLYSPWKTLAQMVEKYLAVHKNPPDYQVFVNTTLAELWQEQGETPDHEVLLGRREPYPCNENAVVPERGLFLTCAVDVQENPPRLEYEVVAWGRDRENWSIAYGAIQVQAENGQPLPVTSEELWDKLNDDVLQRYFQHANGTQLPIMVMVIDTGTRPQPVYAFAVKHAKPSYFAAGLRIHTPRTVVPIKGNEDDLRILSGISREDAARKRQNIRIVSIGTHCVKQELYDLLRDVAPNADGSAVPRCHHFPAEYGKDYFEGLCAEIRVVKANGDLEWKRKPNVRNEPLDLKVYNRGAATIFGIDRFGRKQWQRFADWVAPNRALSPPVQASPQDEPYIEQPQPAPAAPATPRRRPKTVPNKYIFS